MNLASSLRPTKLISHITFKWANKTHILYITSSPLEHRSLGGPLILNITVTLTVSYEK